MCENWFLTLRGRQIEGVREWSAEETNREKVQKDRENYMTNNFRTLSGWKIEVDQLLEMDVWHALGR